MLPLNQGNSMVCSGKDTCFADRQTEVCIPKQPSYSWVALVISFFNFYFTLKEEMQPIPVFLPGKYPGRKSLAGYSPWGCKESDMI